MTDDRSQFAAAVEALRQRREDLGEQLRRIDVALGVLGELGGDDAFVMIGAPGTGRTALPARQALVLDTKPKGRVAMPALPTSAPPAGTGAVPKRGRRFSTAQRFAAVRAADVVGSDSEVARRIGASSSMVGYWRANGYAGASGPDTDPVAVFGPEILAGSRESENPPSGLDAGEAPAPSAGEDVARPDATGTSAVRCRGCRERIAREKGESNADALARHYADSVVCEIRTRNSRSRPVAS